ncbi:serine/threonine-protein kinase Kic1p [Monosporozyma servazzii]
MKKSSRSGSVGTHTNSINKSHIHSTKDNQDQDINSVFRRTEVIGRGKFGVVYKGYNIKTKHIYAIKVLNLDSDADEVEDVQREVQFLSSLKQIPNITRYYGSYLKNTSLWIIMEYCAGGSLRSLLRPGKIDEKYIGVIMKEVLIALKYIHRENIIHRDIKAANILITNEGSVKLCDFGVAAQLNQATLRRQTMAGTPYWMAPEVIMEGVSYDTKVDIWSLGITAYEIATGNPPYCEVEALRAMQLITKSKPPRLEGRSYSAPLKEFIALCLDEDPNERLEADELLNCKFIKLHKSLPTSILKELVTRYLLFRDKNKRDSHLQADEVKIENAKHTNNEANDNPENTNEMNHDNKEKDDTMNDSSQDIDNIAMKWDFDSLSSTDYIIENNINIDAISEEQTDWPQEQVNYAYPDEDPYSYYHTNNNMATNINKNFYQGTTMGKNNPNTIYHNSTFNAPMSHVNTTGNFQSKMMLGTSTQATSNLKGVTGTYNTNMGTGRKTEAKAPKQLLELFEDTDAITELEEPNEDMRRMNKIMSTAHLDTINKNMGTPSGIDSNNVNNKNLTNGGTPTSTSFTINNPHNNLVNSQSYFAQSATQLPHLQTKFSKSSNDSSNTLMTAPTSIEIEIPEELPSSSLPTPLPTEHSSHLQTKPRSSTVSISPLAYPHQQQQQASSVSSQDIKQVSQPQPHGLIRRSTVGGNNSIRSNENDTVEKNKVVSKTIAEEISRSASFINVHGTPNETPNRIKASEIAKIHRRTPSPAKAINGMVVSPVKKSALSPTGLMNSASIVSVSTGNVPTMKPMMGINENKDVLLHPLNANNVSHVTTNNSNTTTNVATNNSGEITVPIPLPVKTNNVIEKEPSRVNSEFKRNNPNLKLQMPLPTTMTRNKLLDANGNVINPSSGSVASSSQSNSAMTNENINQFGFNTSASQNMPVSMTPISEKHMDFSSKIKRSHSVTNRKNSLSNDTLNPPQLPPASHSVLNALVSPAGGGPGTSNSSVPIYNAQTAATNLAQSSGNPVTSNGISTTDSSANSTAMSSGNSTAMSVKSGNNFNGVSGVNTIATSNTVAAPTTTTTTTTTTSTATANTTATIGSASSNNTTDTAIPSSCTTSSTSCLNNNNSTKPKTIVMAPPPSMLRMSLFQDVEQTGTHRRVDRKPEVLHELDLLLHLFEENLPAMENALKQQLDRPIATPSSLDPATPATSNTTTTTTTTAAVPPVVSNSTSNPISNPIQQPVATVTDARG